MRFARSIAATSMWCAQEHIIQLVQQALEDAALKPGDIDCIAYTKVRQCTQQGAGGATRIQDDNLNEQLSMAYSSSTCSSAMLVTS
jgi:tRNA A37 threonylcarbamoyltransferase TsaD